MHKIHLLLLSQRKKKQEMVLITAQSEQLKQEQNIIISAWLVPKATCLLDTGGLSLRCCRNILCLFSTSTQGPELAFFYPNECLHCYIFNQNPQIKHPEMMIQS